MSLVSYSFVLLFLPGSVLIAGAVARSWGRGAAAVVVLCLSLGFYVASAGPFVLPLFLLGVGTYHVARVMGRCISVDGESRAAPWLLLLGIVINAAALIYFKVSTPAVSWLWGIAVPLGVSFITFQQIAYLVDVYRGDSAVTSVTDYAFLVCFFPKVAAGPLVRHGDFLPQIEAASFRIRLDDVSVGTTLFLIGLSKKVLIADRLAPVTSAVFGAAAGGAMPTFAEAWLGALAYTLQIYFDFSGYSDMAIGAGRLFGIQLPINFNSPYKALSVIDFWKRWHMTLSSLFFEFVYFPLVMASRRPAMPYVALFATLLLCAAWHGVGLTFALWGLLHAMYLALNHGWRAARKRLTPNRKPSERWRWLAAAMTFAAIVVAWVPFQASSLASTVTMWRAMSGHSGLSFTVPTIVAEPYASAAMVLVPIGLAIVWFLPNSQEFVAISRAKRPLVQWRPSVSWAVPIGLLAAASLLFMESRQADFIYFKF